MRLECQKTQLEISVVALFISTRDIEKQTVLLCAICLFLRWKRFMQDLLDRLSSHKIITFRCKWAH